MMVVNEVKNNKYSQEYSHLGINYVSIYVEKK